MHKSITLHVVYGCNSGSHTLKGVKEQNVEEYIYPKIEEVT